MRYRFYVEQDERGWYAHCIDLTTDALRDTEDDAIVALQNVSAMYVEWANEARVNPIRKSPLRFRLKYLLHYLRGRKIGHFYHDGLLALVRTW